MNAFFSTITADQKDAIKEIINIGFGRAASSLSILIGSPVLLHVPDMDIYPISGLTKTMAEYIPREAIIIHQIFSGDIAGNVLLFIDVESASVLVDMLSGGVGLTGQLSPSDREALIEVGNILMNGYIGSFSNLLNLSLSFDPPHIREESVARWLESMQDSSEGGGQYVVLVRTEFVVANVKANGYVALLLDIHSLKALIETVEFGMKS